MERGYTPTGFLNNYNPIEKVQCAAIWIKGVSRHKDFDQYAVQPFNALDGVVICGWRHHSCFFVAMRIWDITGLETIEGFLTSHNRFVDRFEGAKIATLAGQLKREVDLLSSEDLY